jgi:hypothetical protein
MEMIASNVQATTNLFIFAMTQRAYFVIGSISCACACTLLAGLFPVCQQPRSPSAHPNRAIQSGAGRSPEGRSSNASNFFLPGRQPIDSLHRRDRRDGPPALQSGHSEERSSIPGDSAKGRSQGSGGTKRTRGMDRVRGRIFASHGRLRRYSRRQFLPTSRAATNVVERARHAYASRTKPRPWASREAFPAAMRRSMEDQSGRHRRLRASERRMGMCRPAYPPVFLAPSQSIAQQQPGARTRDSSAYADCRFFGVRPDNFSVLFDYSIESERTRQIIKDCSTQCYSV